jgi:hypothetical protein
VSNCPTINDEYLNEMVYDDDKKCELLNKYFSLVSKLEEEHLPVSPLKVKLMTQLFVENNLKWFGNFFGGYFEHFMANFVRT